MILDDDTPMLYHCFICQESGVVNSTFLDKLGIDNFHDGDVNELDQIIRGNSSGYRKQIKSSNGDVECNLKEYLINDGYDNNIVEYMKKRFNIKSIDTNKMLEWCVVSNIKKYLVDIGYKQVTDPHIILNNRIWFRMRNGSVVGRLISGKGERWMVISNKREHEKNIYVIGNLFNLSGRVIRVWMGEGVMDGKMSVAKEPAEEISPGRSLTAAIAAQVNHHVFDGTVFPGNLPVRINDDADGILRQLLAALIKRVIIHISFPTGSKQEFIKGDISSVTHFIIRQGGIRILLPYVTDRFIRAACGLVAETQVCFRG